MTSKNKDVFSIDDLRGVALAWVKDSSSSPEDYLTKEGLAYLNGFLQANNVAELIKIEKYNNLLEDYEDLIDKYDDLKQRYDKNIDVINTLNVKLSKKSKINKFFGWFKY